MIRASMTIGRFVLFDVSLFGIDDDTPGPPPALAGGTGTVLDPVDDDGPSLGFTAQPRRAVRAR